MACNKRKIDVGLDPSRKRAKVGTVSMGVTLFVVLALARFRMRWLRKRVEVATASFKLALTPSAANLNWCIRCKTEKPLDEFLRDKNKKKGVRNICRPCYASQSTAQYRARRGDLLKLPRKANSNGEWSCITCKVYKPTDAFHKNTYSTNGLQGDCKKCQRENQRQRRLAKAETDPSTIPKAKKTRQPNSKNEWECSTCREYKPLTEFHKNKSEKNGHSSRCKDCQQSYARQYLAKNRQPKLSREEDGQWRCTSCDVLKEEAEYSSYNEGFTMCSECCRAKRRNPSLAGYIGQTYANAKARNQKHGGPTISREELLEQYLLQRGRCYYSDRFMSFVSFTHWQISVERLNNSAGYQLGNVVFICAEFNTTDQTKGGQRVRQRSDGSAQWSRSKYLNVKEILAQSDLDSALSHFEDALSKPQTRRRCVRPSSTIDGHLFCSHCNKYKLAPEFSNHRGKTYSVCRECCEVDYERRRSNVRSFLMNLHNHMKWNAHHRKQAFVMDISDVIDQIRAQGALGAYSGIPMTFRTKSEWQCSAERLDNSIGYVPGNVVFECLEFNTPDFARGHNVDKELIQGSPQWSKDKFDEVFYPCGE